MSTGGPSGAPRSAGARAASGATGTAGGTGIGGTGRGTAPGKTPPKHPLARRLRGKKTEETLAKEIGVVMVQLGKLEPGGERKVWHVLRKYAKCFGPECVLGALNELMRRNDVDRTIEAFECIRTAHWFEPDPMLYARMIEVLARNSRTDTAAALFASMDGGPAVPLTGGMAMLVGSGGGGGAAGRGGVREDVRNGVRGNSWDSGSDDDDFSGDDVDGLDDELARNPGYDDEDEDDPDGDRWGTSKGRRRRLKKKAAAAGAASKGSLAAAARGAGGGNRVGGGSGGAGGAEGTAATASAAALAQLPRLKACVRTPSVYAAMIDAYGRRHQATAALALLHQMKATPGCAPDAAAYGSAVKALCLVGRTTEAEDLLADMAHRGVLPDATPHVAPLFTHPWSQVGSEGTVLSGAHHGGRGSSSGHGAQGSAVKALCLVGRTTEAEDLLADMAHRGVLPDATPFNALIDAYGGAGQLQLMRDKFFELTSVGLRPDVRTFNGLIRGFGSAGQLQLMRDKFFGPTRVGLRPDVRTFNGLFRGRQAVFENMRMGYRTAPNVHTCAATCVLHCSSLPCCASRPVPLSLSPTHRAGLLSEMEAVFENMQMGYRTAPNVHTFHALMDAYGAHALTSLHRQDSKGTEWFESQHEAAQRQPQQEREQEEEEQTGRREGRQQEARQRRGGEREGRFGRSERRGGDADADAAEGQQGGRQRSAERRRGVFERMQRTLLHLVKMRYRLHAESFDLPLKYLSQAGMVEEMEKVFRLMRAIGAGMVEEMEKVFRLMRAIGVRPTTTTFTLLADAYSAAGQPKQILRLLKQMQSMPLAARKENNSTPNSGSSSSSSNGGGDSSSARSRLLAAAAVAFASAVEIKEMEWCLLQLHPLNTTPSSSPTPSSTSSPSSSPPPSPSSLSRSTSSASSFPSHALAEPARLQAWVGAGGGGMGVVSAAVEAYARAGMLSHMEALFLGAQTLGMGGMGASDSDWGGVAGEGVGGRMGEVGVRGGGIGARSLGGGTMGGETMGGRMMGGGMMVEGRIWGGREGRTWEGNGGGSRGWVDEPMGTGMAVRGGVEYGANGTYDYGGDGYGGMASGHTEVFSLPSSPPPHPHYHPRGRHRLVLSLSACNAMAEAYAAVASPGGVRRVMAYMLRHGVARDETTIAALLSACAAVADMAGMEAALQRAVRRGMLETTPSGAYVSPSGAVRSLPAGAYVAAAQAFGAVGKVGRMREMLGIARQVGQVGQAGVVQTAEEVERECYLTAIDAFLTSADNDDDAGHSRSGGLADTLRKREGEGGAAGNRWSEADSPAAASAIGSAAGAPEEPPALERAEALLEEMHGRGMCADVATYSAVLAARGHGAVVEGAAEEVLEVEAWGMSEGAAARFRPLVRFLGLSLVEGGMTRDLTLDGGLECRGVTFELTQKSLEGGLESRGVGQQEVVGRFGSQGSGEERRQQLTGFDASSAQEKALFHDLRKLLRSVQGSAHPASLRPLFASLAAALCRFGRLRRACLVLEEARRFGAYPTPPSLPVPSLAGPVWSLDLHLYRGPVAVLALAVWLEELCWKISKAEKEARDGLVEGSGGERLGRQVLKGDIEGDYELQWPARAVIILEASGHELLEPSQGRRAVRDFMACSELPFKALSSDPYGRMDAEVDGLREWVDGKWPIASDAGKTAGSDALKHFRPGLWQDVRNFLLVYFEQ
ncbi:unnamed protein product [Closterium sp. NIES-65]|nr:unnamed protein product [Closterium sp. NIES-65]